jgi:hypothetical protein
MENIIPNRAQIWLSKDAPQCLGFGVVTAMISLGGITTATIAAVWGKPYDRVDGSLDAASASEIGCTKRGNKTGSKKFLKLHVWSVAQWECCCRLLPVTSTSLP